MVRIALLLSLTIAASPQVAWAQSGLVKTTAVYREVDGHAIHADVYRPSGEEIVPVVVWIHGGALIMGHREAIHPEVRRLASDQQCALISLDYRLAPETKLPELISDIEAAFRWLADEGARTFHLDSRRWVVCGGSAGGYLTLVTGYRAQPRPRALVALYGYGDLIGDWYSTPSPHARHNPRKISRAEAMRQSDGTVVSDARKRSGNGHLIYLYYRQNGIWPVHVSGFDQRNLATKIAPFEPLRNLTADYPPTLLIHGTNDTDVPFEQSAMMAEKLVRLGVPVSCIPIRNAEHGFEGGDPQAIQLAYRAMRDFIVRHLEAK